MKMIYVDDEIIQLENFRISARNLNGLEETHFFSRSAEALQWVQEHPVDVAFLDIEMPGMNGMELARQLKKLDENIKIIFVTAYEQYALEAFGVRAVGYLLKPYSREDIQKELDNVRTLMPQQPQKRVQITTMPDLVVRNDGKIVSLGGA